MKNENKKEIDMIVGEIISHSIADDADHLGLTLCEGAFEKVATSILTKLQKDEIVLARGKVKLGKVNMGGTEIYYIPYTNIDTREVLDKVNKKFGIKKYLGKTVILTAKVVKDE